VFHQFVDISEKRVTAKSVYICIHKYGPISKNEILEKLGSSLANISRFLLELENSGMILKSKGSGRLSGQYRANPDAAYAFGGYINGDVIGLGLCDVTGRVIDCHETLFADADTPEKAIEFFSSAHKKLLSYPEAAKSMGTSIAIVGPMDKEKNLIVYPPDMPKWGEVPFKEMYEKAIDSPMDPELFAEAILLGDLLFENHEINQNIILFWLDEGIGASISHKGRMDLDQKDRSMILGHQIVDFNGIPCHCGKRGCLVNYGSIPSFRKTLLPYYRVEEKEVKRAESLHKENPWKHSIDLEIIKNATSRDKQLSLMDGFLSDFDNAYFAGLWNTINGIRPNKVIFCGRIASYYKERLEGVMSRIMTSDSSETSNIDIHWIDLDSNHLVRSSAARVFNNYINIVD
jgi:predicted NBD/HSP70 family sugar kinase